MHLCTLLWGQYRAHWYVEASENKPKTHDKPICSEINCQLQDADPYIYACMFLGCEIPAGLTPYEFLIKLGYVED